MNSILSYAMIYRLFWQILPTLNRCSTGPGIPDRLIVRFFQKRFRRIDVNGDEDHESAESFAVGEICQTN